MRKTVHIIGASNFGGAEILVRDLHQKKDKPFESFILYHTEGDLLKEEDENCKKVSFNRLNLQTIRDVRDYIRQNEIDVVHVHSVINPLKLLPVLMFSKVRMVFTVHGYSLNSRIINKRITFQFFNSVLFVSKTLKDAYIKSGNEKYSVLYNGIDPAKFALTSSVIREEIFIPEDKILMGFVGNFNTVRDQLTVCKALKQLKEQGIDFTFLFVGAAHIPELYEACYSYCEEHNLLENVKFFGSRSDVPEILAALDLFVYSSNHDTFGIAVVEAMMSGTPVVVNDLDVFKEITNEGQYARLYKTKDEVSLAENINHLIQNTEERKELGLRGKQWAEKKYSIEAHIHQLNELYTELLAKRTAKNIH